MYIDSHAHLNDKAFENERKQIVENYLSVGVNKIINAAFDLDSSKLGQALADEFKSVYFSAGVHPEYAHTVNDGCILGLKEIIKDKKCVAVGEAGLDYHYEGYDKKVQAVAFERQLQLAKDSKLPIIIHSRDATEDMVNILKGNKELLEYSGVMHCFSGSKETAKIFLDMGLYISFSGVVTFKNAPILQEVARYVPRDRYLAETDCPYMAPVPNRGKQNQPAYVKFVYQKLAELKEIEEEVCVKEIVNNTLTLFKGLKNG